MQTPKFEIRPYINLALRRKWWIMIPFVLSVAGGAAFVSIAPKTYKASTLVLLEPQSIPNTFVQSTITETIEGRLRTITQQIQSRTNLEKVIKDFQLDRQTSGQAKDGIVEMIREHIPFLKKEGSAQEQYQSDERVTMIRLVDEIRKNLQVNMRGGAAGGGSGRDQHVAFEISFEWHDQQLVAPVANAIASRFIEENLNAREEMAMSTTDFLDKEAAAIRVELETREKELEAFKKQHMGMLPDQLESNINILNQLREEAVNLEGRLEQEKQQVMLIKSQAQMARMERDALAAAIRPDQGRTAGDRREAQMTTDQLTSGSLEDLERELKRLTSQYTDKHPDIMAVKRRIDAMKKDGATGETGAAGGMPPDASLDRISLQLIPINANIESYKTQIQEVRKQIESYKERVEKTPQVEMALNKVMRDYETVRHRYDTLLSKKLDAKLAEQMEKRKKGEQFRVLDPAIKPPKPFKPDIRRVMAMALALGLGLGGGLAYLREMLDPRFYDPGEVEAYLDAKVMISLPIAKMEGSSGK